MDTVGSADGRGSPDGGQAKAREWGFAKQIVSAGSQLRLAYIKDTEEERCPAPHLDANTPLPPGNQAPRQEEGPDQLSCHSRLFSSLSFLCRYPRGLAGSPREQEAWKPSFKFMWANLRRFLRQCLQNLLKNCLQWTNSCVKSSSSPFSK